MRFIPLSVVCAAALAGCVPQATPEQQSEFAGNMMRASVSPAANRIVVETSTYLVEPNSSRSVAMVTPIAGLQHNIDRMEKAATLLTGCVAVAQPDVTAMMRGNKTVSIPTIRLKRTGGRYPIDLTC